MRNILILLFCLHNFFSQSQDFEVINEDGNKRYQIGIDKLDYISKTYPDGWWEIHDSFDRDRVLYFVNIENNKIHGSFIDLTGNGKTIGNYYKDSLWTFLTAPEDSTFKMGTWRYTLSDILLPDEFYSIKYENDSLRSVIWNFYNGTIGREARYRKGFGLTDVIYYENKTNRIISKEEKNLTSMNLFFYNGSIRATFSVTLAYFTHIMKTISFLFLTFFHTQFCTAEKLDINIEFKNALLKHMPEIDLDKNNEISVNEAESITKIRLINSGLKKVEGLKSFPNLKSLILTSNQIVKISIIGLTKLEEVYCLNNRLKSITLDSLPSLKFILLDGNDLQEISLNRAPLIEHLSCGYNKIKNLDVSQLKNLKHLGIVHNHIENIDISQNQNLETFQFQFNPIFIIDISKNPKLVFDKRFTWDQKIKLIATDLQMEAIKKDVEEEIRNPPPSIFEKN